MSVPLVHREWDAVLVLNDKIQVEVKFCRLDLRTLFGAAVKKIAAGEKNSSNADQDLPEAKANGKLGWHQSKG